MCVSWRTSVQHPQACSISSLSTTLALTLLCVLKAQSRRQWSFTCCAPLPFWLNYHLIFFFCVCVCSVVVFYSSVLQSSAVKLQPNMDHIRGELPQRHWEQKLASDFVQAQQLTYGSMQQATKPKAIWHWPTHLLKEDLGPEGTTQI